MPRHDLVIHAPFAADFYDAAAAVAGGGAERQTYLLARALAERGLRVAHVVYPVAEPVLDGLPITLIEHPKLAADGSARAFGAKLARVWRELNVADASVLLHRGATGTLGVFAGWAALHRRKVLFASANVSDFEDGGFADPKDPRSRLYRAGLRRTDQLVVQSADQLELAHARYPKLAAEQVNSFVAPQPATGAPGEALLWISRLASYKQPLKYVELARALPDVQFRMVAIKTSTPEYESTLAELRRADAELPNLELVPQQPHAALQDLIGRSAAIVNTSTFEGMPNTWLEGWSHGIPALTLSFDPDQRIERHGLGISAGGSWDAFVDGARRLWEGRQDRCGLSDHVREHVATVHGTQVADAWERLVRELVR